MKKLLLIPLFLLFSGCVSYYTPVNAIEDGVYYAEDDPVYNNTAYVYNYDSYYPWASLDYFYLGASSFYPSYRYGFGGYVGSGFSIGFSSGYSPWYTPYYSYYRPYGYYSPWYGYPRYGYGYQRYGYGYGNYYGRPGYRNCYYGNCASHYSKRGKGHKRDKGYNNDRYSGNDDTNRRARNYRDPNNGEDYARQPNAKGDRRGRDRSYDPSNNRTTRYISTSPASQAGNQGMVVRSRGDAKQPQKSRTHQQRTQPATNQNRSRVTPVQQPRPVTNQGRSRVTPVRQPKPVTDPGRSRITPIQQPQPRLRADPGQQAQPYRQTRPVQRPRPETRPASVVRQPNAGRSAPVPAKSVRSQPSQRAPKQNAARSNKSSSRASSPPRSSAGNRNRDRD